VTVKPITLNGGQLRQLQAAECLQLMACTTANASMNCPHGTAPSSPVNGDLWTTSAGLYARINGSTVGPLGTSTGDFTGPGSSTADHLVTFADGTGKVGKDSGLSLDTDTALGANSDSKIPSQKAVKTYADALWPARMHIRMRWCRDSVFGTAAGWPLRLRCLPMSIPTAVPVSGPR
jgi:hypothetical protein